MSRLSVPDARVRAVELRKQGRKQIEVAEILGYPQPTISRWLKEAGAPQRARRTKSDVEALDSALVSIVAATAPTTIRAVFYQAVVAGAVPKTEAGARAVGSRLILLRDDEATPGLNVPVSSIVDGIRRVRRPYTVLNLQEALEDTAIQYRRHVWADQDVLPVIVLEKLALVGVFEDICDQWDVPLVPLQGFGSISLAWQLAELINDSGKEAAVHYFGDWDPSGVLIDPAFERRLVDYCDETVAFDRVALTPDLIAEHALPTRPTKESTHSIGFDGDSVELDAMPTPVLRGMLVNTIRQHIDPQALQVLRVAEDSEREILRAICNRDFVEIADALNIEVPDSVRDAS